MPEQIKPIHPRLQADVIKEALLDFQELAETAFKQRSEDDQTAVQNWVDQIGLITPQFALRPDSIESLTQEVFGNEAIRDYVLELHFRFFALCGSGDDFINRLIQNLIDAMCLDGPDLEQSVLPDTVTQSGAISIFSQREAPFFLSRIFGEKRRSREAQFNLFLFLRNNLWAVVVLLIYLAGIKNEGGKSN